MEGMDLPPTPFIVITTYNKWRREKRKQESTHSSMPQFLLLSLGSTTSKSPITESTPPARLLPSVLFPFQPRLPVLGPSLGGGGSASLKLIYFGHITLLPVCKTWECAHLLRDCWTGQAVVPVVIFAGAVAGKPCPASKDSYLFEHGSALSSL